MRNWFVDELSVSLLIAGSELAVVFGIAFMALAIVVERRWRRRHRAVSVFLRLRRAQAAKIKQQLLKVVTARGSVAKEAKDTVDTLLGRETDLHTTVAAAVLDGDREALDRTSQALDTLIDAYAALGSEFQAADDPPLKIDSPQADNLSDEKVTQEVIELNAKVATLKQENTRLSEELARVREESEQVVAEYAAMYKRLAQRKKKEVVEPLESTTVIETESKEEPQPQD